MPRGEPLAITQLPTEMISHVFAWLDPVSFSTTKRVCRLFYDIIKGNQSLCRKVYLLQMVSYLFHQATVHHANMIQGQAGS